MSGLPERVAMVLKKRPKRPRGAKKPTSARERGETSSLAFVPTCLVDEGSEGLLLGFVPELLLHPITTHAHSRSD